MLRSAGCFLFGRRFAVVATLKRAYLIGLLVVVGLAVGWWVESWRSPSRQIEFRARNMEAALKKFGYKVEQPTPYRVIVIGQGKAHFDDELWRSESPKK